MIATSQNRWIGLWRSCPDPRGRLIVFPHAGAGASVYHRWMADLGEEDWLDFVAIQLPGRENRLRETPYVEMPLLIEALMDALRPMTERPFMLFGYSLGALVAYELAVRLVVEGRSPASLVVAARGPNYERRHDLRSLEGSRESVIEHLRRFGGTPAALMNSPLFDEHFLPLLRADWTLADSFTRDIAAVLPCPIIALGATDDQDVPVSWLDKWALAAGNGFTRHLFDGGHFFLYSRYFQLLQIIREAARASLLTHRGNRSHDGAHV